MGQCSACAYYVDEHEAEGELIPMLPVRELTKPQLARGVALPTLLALSEVRAKDVRDGAWAQLGVAYSV